MVQNQRAYLLLYAITTIWIMCVQEKAEFSNISQTTWLSPTKISGDLSFVILQQSIHSKMHSKLCR